MGQVKLRVQGITYVDDIHVPILNNAIDSFTLQECDGYNRKPKDFYMLQVYNAGFQHYRDKMSNECTRLRAENEEQRRQRRRAPIKQEGAATGYTCPIPTSPTTESTRPARGQGRVRSRSRKVTTPAPLKD